MNEAELCLLSRSRDDCFTPNQIHFVMGTILRFAIFDEVRKKESAVHALFTRKTRFVQIEKARAMFCGNKSKNTLRHNRREAGQVFPSPRRVMLVWTLCFVLAAFGRLDEDWFDDEFIKHVETATLDNVTMALSDHLRRHEGQAQRLLFDDNYYPEEHYLYPPQKAFREFETFWATHKDVKRQLARQLEQTGRLGEFTLQKLPKLIDSVCGWANVLYSRPPLYEPDSDEDLIGYD